MRFFSLTLILPLSLSLSLSAPGHADPALEALKDRIVGRWTSIACEIRPSVDQANPDGKPLPSYLTRDFTYDATGGFEANITVYADPACAAPVVAYDFAGEIVWHDANPAVEGAYSQDYRLDRKLEITVLAQPFADQLNGLPQGACGDATYEVGTPQDILRKPCILLNFVEGSAVVVDHDLLYVREDAPNLLFMGGKHVDGTGFYFPQYRPTVGLQQPLLKVGG